MDRPLPPVAVVVVLLSASTDPPFLPASAALPLPSACAGRPLLPASPVPLASLAGTLVPIGSPHVCSAARRFGGDHFSLGDTPYALS
ncbi:hypothetical protein GCM10010264_12260 [Streptomyces globisporus]|nr:hypothetical protein GCM10010264_12260 [Streptomyces globisporus]